MEHVPLSRETRRRLNAVFAPADLTDAEILLVEECGCNLPFYENSTPKSLERVRFAAMKIANGSIDRLCDAIQLARSDWRDLLVLAGFANDLKAHFNWRPASGS
jgi:hypothetical protein